MSVGEAWSLGLLRLPYRRAWALQQRLQQARIEGRVPDTLLLVEHDPVITLGRSADPSNVLWSGADLAARGVDLVQVERGGDVTYHGPGQVTGYPILDLESRGRDLAGYLRGLEEVMLLTLARYQISGQRCEGFTGVWVGREKVGAIGVKLRNWVTMHGFAFNVDLDLEPFRLIVPCGLADRGVTSLGKLLGGRGEPSTEQVARELREDFAEVFGLDFAAVDLEWLERV